MKTILLSSFITLTLFLQKPALAQNETQQQKLENIYKSPQSEATLWATNDANNPNKIYIVLSLDLEDGWHTYWQNPGDSGLPPTFDVKIEKFEVKSPLRYPTPERIESGPLVTFGYHKTVILIREWTMPEVTDQKIPSLTVTANIKYLVCNEQCLVEKATLKTNYHANWNATDPRLDAIRKALVNVTKLDWPKRSQNWVISAKKLNEAIQLNLRHTQQSSIQVLDFFPAPQSPLLFQKPKITKNNSSQFSLVLPTSDLTIKDPKLSGLVLYQKTPDSPIDSFWIDQDWPKDKEFPVYSLILVTLGLVGAVILITIILRKIRKPS